MMDYYNYEKIDQEEGTTLRRKRQYRSPNVRCGKFICLTAPIWMLLAVGNFIFHLIRGYVESTKLDSTTWGMLIVLDVLLFIVGIIGLISSIRSPFLKLRLMIGWMVCILRRRLKIVRN